MNRPTIILLLAAMLPFFSTAQNDSLPELVTSIPTNHEISAKVLGIDYGSPNDADLALTYGLEVAYRYRIIPQVALAIPLKIGVANVVGDTLNRNITSLDVLAQLYPLGEKGLVQPYLLGGAGYVIENVDNGHLQIPLGAGLNFRVGENSYLNLQGEYRIAPDAEDRNNYQLGAGYVYRFSAAGNVDTDGDGVLDEEDACPEEYGLVSAQGCPDSDGDGIGNAVDDCPEEPGPANTGGCPDTDGDGYANLFDPCPQLAGPAPLDGCPDRDGDGVNDVEDECPDTAGLEANAGCPEEEPEPMEDEPIEEEPMTEEPPMADKDGDGVPDDKDQCPSIVGPVSTQGCPDRDNDGVPNHLDRCPDQAGPYTGCPDTDGDGIIDADDLCPTEAGLTTTKGCPEINQETRDVLDLAMRSVQFETASANLKAESYPILNQIAGILNRYPAYRLRISGHTDNIGDANENQRLSEERAEACYQYLLAQGAKASRITYAGFGEDYPISSNRTPAGRTLNRRVEFELIIQ